LEEARFRQGEAVLKRATRDEIGTVIAEPTYDAGEWWYKVQFARRRESIVEEDLDAVEATDRDLRDLVLAGRWGRLEAFRRVLAVERIRTQNRSTVYSFNAQRILFEPHQYKPLLKFLDSIDRRLLIADEVGLGKTIEAGLIQAEMEARAPMQRVLVVCPSRLTTKWREEMNRKFGQDFEVYRKRGLEQLLDRIEDNPVRTRFRGVVSIQSMRARGLVERFTAVVDELDLLIVDEAHHARNPGTLTSQMVGDLGQIAGAMLLLSATPLHLHSRDLFTLLSHMRPTEFANAELFDLGLERHGGILTAQSIVRARASSRLGEAAQEVRRVYRDPDGAVTDALAAQVVTDLEGRPPESARDWVDLERRIDELHILGGIVSRTRKRDVQEHAPVRRSRPWVFGWTEEEDRLYGAVLGSSSDGGWPSRGLSLGQIQRARQAASCLPAALEHWGDEIRDANTADEQVDLDLDELDAEQGDGDLALPDDWSSVPDSKFDKLVEILRAIDEEEPGAKVLLFTFFVGTSKYLARRLRELGWETERIAGDVPAHPHDPKRDLRGRAIERFEKDPKVRVMVSTEVGSEGLDFQFCHHLVNYDLPWNPMVVEQRIGRIDRFGQESDVVHVHTLVVEGTVEDRILNRLYERIGLFERSIGSLETILGDTMRELQQDFISGRLSPAEAAKRADEAAAAIEHKIKETEKLEEKAAELFGHEEYIRAEMARVRRLGRFLSSHALLSVLRGYLDRNHPGVGIKQEEPHIWSIAVPDELYADALDRAKAEYWDGYQRCRDERGRLRFTTEGDVAFKRKDVDLLNVSHPLIVAATDALRDLLDDPVARVSQAEVGVPDEDRDTFPEGVYHVAVFAQEIAGIRSRTIFDAIAWSGGEGRLLPAEEAERLLHLALDEGGDWSLERDADAVAEDAWEAIESEARRRNRHLKGREQDQNDALAQRRRKVIDDELALRERQIDEKVETARSRGRQEKVIRLFEAQRTKARHRHETKARELEARRNVTVALSDPLAVCALRVRHGE